MLRSPGCHPHPAREVVGWQGGKMPVTAVVVKTHAGTIETLKSFTASSRACLIQNVIVARAQRVDRISCRRRRCAATTLVVTGRVWTCCTMHRSISINSSTRGTVHPVNTTTPLVRYDSNIGLLARYNGKIIHTAGIQSKNTSTPTTLT